MTTRIARAFGLVALALCMFRPSPGYGRSNPTRPHFTTLRDGSDSATFAIGINNDGIVVGGSGTIYDTRGFESRSAQYRTSKFPGTYVYAYAESINNLGTIVGTTIDGIYYYGYSYHNGGFHRVDFPGAPATIASGINDSGFIVGHYFIAASTYAFAFEKGKYVSFGYPGALATFANGINAAGQVVGDYQLPDLSVRGFFSRPIARFRVVRSLLKNNL